VIWGAAAPIIKFTLRGIDPLPFLAYRFSISAVISILFFTFTKSKIPKGIKKLSISVTYGLLAYTLALIMLFVGLNDSTALDLTLIGALGPLTVVLGGAFIFHDHITHKEKLGISIVFLGAIFNSFYPFIFGGKSMIFGGNTLLVLYLLIDSSSVIIAKEAVKIKVKSLSLTNFGFLVGAVTLIPFTIYKVGFNNLISQIAHLPLKYHLGVWYMAVLSGSLAYFLYVKAQKSIEVSEATIFNYLQPIIAVPLAILWLGEKLTTHFLLGAVLIVTGLFIAERKTKV
jgi:drug/metabolite transporter (DMT)-like permease